MYYLINDIIKLNYSQKANAQGKAREDVTRTLRSLGYSIINVPHYRISINNVIHDLPIFTQLISGVFLLIRLRKVRKGDYLFIQDYTLPYIQIICFIARLFHICIAYIIHDVPSIRFNKKSGDIDLLNKANILFVHSDNMKNLLKSKGVKQQMIVLRLFDYYSDDAMIDIDDIMQNKKNIVFAGNLSKSIFLHKLFNTNLFKDIYIHLYGILYDIDLIKNPNINYISSFSPENTSVVKGGWGLVWDGDSIETCSGDLGEYLRYNSSHKLSLYLSCSLPIIVWEKSSVAKWVSTNNVGICISNLSEIENKVNNISNDEYKIMINNCRKVGLRLRNGQFLKDALIEAMLL